MSALPSPVRYEGLLRTGTAAPSAGPLLQNVSLSPTPAPSPSFQFRYGEPRDESALFWLAVILLMVFVYGMCCICKGASSSPRLSVPAPGLPLTEGASRDTPLILPLAAPMECMSAEERRDYITQLLIVEKFHGITPSEEFKSGPLDVSQSFYDPTSAKDAAGELCAICLEQFRTGQDVCVSRNAKCNHHFHSTCALEWLMKSQLCPCCRRDYFARRSIVEDEESKVAPISTIAPEPNVSNVETENQPSQEEGPIEGSAPVEIASSSGDVVSTNV